MPCPLRQDAALIAWVSSRSAHTTDGALMNISMLQFVRISGQLRRLAPEISSPECERVAWRYAHDKDVQEDRFSGTAPLAAV
eukprot:SAG25_NODE_3468_length_1069_cov_2.581276_2_plen_82_part_00